MGIKKWSEIFVEGWCICAAFLQTEIEKLQTLPIWIHKILSYDERMIV